MFTPVPKRLNLLEMSWLLKRAEQAGLISSEEYRRAARAWLRVVASEGGTLSPPTANELDEAKAITARAGIVIR